MPLGVSWTTLAGDDISTVLVPGQLPADGRIHVKDWDGYAVELVVELVHGRYRCRDLRISQGPGGTEVSGETVRTLPLARLIRAGVNHVEQLGALIEKSMELPVTDDDTRRLEWVARAYRRAYAVGDPPKQTVAQGLGASPATAGRWIARAREAGYLAAAEGPGKGGG